MRRGAKNTLFRGPIFNAPFYATIKRSSDGDWTFEGRKIGWVHFARSPRSGSAVLNWLRVGEYVLMIGYGRPEREPS